MRNKDQKLAKLSLNILLGQSNITEFQSPMDYMLRLRKEVDLETLDFLRMMETKKINQKLRMYLVSSGEIMLDNYVSGLESYVLDCKPSNLGKFELSSNFGFFSLPREIYLTDDCRLRLRYNGELPTSFIQTPKLTVPKFDESLFNSTLVDSDDFNIFRD